MREDESRKTDAKAEHCDYHIARLKTEAKAHMDHAIAAIEEACREYGAFDGCGAAEAIEKATRWVDRIAR